MKKYIFSFIIWLLVIVSIPFHCISAYANTSEDYKTFSQLDPRWADYTIPNAGYTIGSAGCFITSIAVCMGYANKDLRDVDKFNPRVLSDGMSYVGGGLVSTSCSNVDPTFTKVLDDDKLYTSEEAKKKVVDYFNQGYYVVIMTSGAPITTSTHFSPIVGVDNGTPVVWDVAGGAHSDWDTWANAGISNIDVFQSSKMKSTESMNGSNNVDEEKPSTEEEIQEITDLIAEYDLIGMKDASILGNNRSDINLPKHDELSITQQGNLAAIDEAKKSNKFLLSESLSVMSGFLGMLIILYGVLMIVFMLFDWFNAFFELSLLSFLTFGKYRLVGKDYFEKNKIIGYDKSLKVTYVTPLRCIIIASIVIAIGILLSTGLLQDVLYNLWIFIVERVSRWKIR